VTVAAPTYPGILRGVNLDLARYRMDSARLLGTTLLRDTVLDAIRHQHLMGGPTWIAERLVGRVRYLIGKYNLNLSIQDSFDKLERVLTPLSGLRVDDGPFSSGQRFCLSAAPPGQTSNLGVRSSNLFGRATSEQNWADSRAVFPPSEATRARNSALLWPMMRTSRSSTSTL
jgi:hypothetical protein